MTHAFSVPGRYDQVAIVCQFVVAGAEKSGFGIDEIFQIELACDEACTNVIEHAYGGEEKGDILVTWDFSAGAFTITIVDEGRPFDPDEVPKPKIPVNADDLEELQIGGLGIHFMRKLMDEVHFHMDNKQGNRLVMVKYLSETRQQ
jgi:serine/threonine-protein kinase RsbW